VNEDVIPLPRLHGEGYHWILINRETGDAMCTCPGFERWGHCYRIEDARKLVMTTQVTVAQPQQMIRLQPPTDELSAMIDLSSRLYKSAARPEWMKSDADMLTVMLKAWEMNISYTTAMDQLGLVNGKIVANTQLLVALCLVNEPDITFEIIAEDAESTTVRFTRPSKGYKKEFCYTNTMAREAGLIDKPVWKAYRSVMRTWAGFKRLIRVYAPDLILGVQPRVRFDGASLPAPAGIALPPEDPEQGDPNAIEAEYTVSAAPVEDPDVLEQVPTTNETQAAAIRDYIEAISGKHGQEGQVKTQAAASERWPYAGSGPEFDWGHLTETDAAAFIALLKSIEESKDGKPSLGL
jgi:hypothetical protein